MVKSVRAGDRRAIDRLMKLYRPALVNFAVNRGLKPDEAEDAAQEALVRLFGTLPGVDARKGKFRSLLLAITRNVVHEILRKRGKTVPLETDEISGPEREESFDLAWIRNIVMVALDDLRKECEERKTHFYKALKAQMSGTTHEEIAKELGVETKQIKSYVHQAREKVRKVVEAHISDYTVAGEYEEECKYLLRFLDV